MNLYTFNTKSWHCKMWSFCYGIDPSVKFKTMCPYFWGTLGTMLIFPIILPFRLFGVKKSTISNTISGIQTRYENRQIKKLQKSKEEVEKLLIEFNNSGNEDLLKKIRKNKYFSSSYDNRVTLLQQLFQQFSTTEIDKLLVKIYFAKEKSRQERVNEFKNSSIFKVIGTSIIIIAGILLLYYALIPLGQAMAANWKAILEIFAGGCLFFIAICIFIFILDLTSPFFRKLMMLLRKGIEIVFDMGHALYKQYCPIITWKDDKDSN